MPENNPPPSNSGSETEKPPKAWTIMVYLAGDNNLADECVYALTEMKAANPDSRIQVVAQFDPMGRGKQTQRFVLNRLLDENDEEPKGLAAEKHDEKLDEGRKDRRKIKEDRVDIPAERTVPFPDPRRPMRPPVEGATDEEGETDSGDPKVLFDFITWTVVNHPADRYMVVLSGHGSGPNEQVFLRDDSSNGSLTIKELGKVFNTVKNELKDKRGEPLEIDIVGIDSCLMSMAEVCHELSGSVKYMISSESYAPRAGWPYGRVLERLSGLLTDGKASAEDLAAKVVEEHVDFYLDYADANGLSVDISMMDVRRAGELVTAVNALATKLKDILLEDKGGADFLDQIVLAHWEAQSYNGELYVDLCDFCECLKARYRPDLVKLMVPDQRTPDQVNADIQLRQDVGKLCTDVINLITKALVMKSCYTGATLQYSNGVSIYFPWAEVEPDYKASELSFLEHSGWREFLEAYVTKTRRHPRGFKPQPDAAFPIALEEVRKTPTEGKGPANVPIRSMRNPPIQVIKGGLSKCRPGKP